MKVRCCSLPKFKNVTHVIFDLDGTLLDTEGIYFLALEDIFTKYGATFKNEYKLKFAGRTQADIAKTCIEEFNFQTTVEEFVDNYKNMSLDKLADADFMPGAEKFIKHLHEHNIPIAVATSSAKDAFEMKTANKKDIFDLMDHAVCGDDPELKNGKPAPDIYLLCASRFPDKPHPSQVLVFEDAANGVKGALAAGMQVIMIPDEVVPCQIWMQATLRIDSFEYMIPELFGLPPYKKPDTGFVNEIEQQ